MGIIGVVIVFIYISLLKMGGSKGIFNVGFNDFIGDILEDY